MAPIRLAPRRTEVQEEVEEDVDGSVMTEKAARQLTDRIRRAAESIDIMLLEAYEGRAHLALGYDTWDKYVSTEFGLSRSEGYRKLDQARVTRELVEATGLSRGRDIVVSGKQASHLRPDLPAAKAEISAAVATGVPLTEAVKAAVKARTGPGGRIIPARSRETNGHRPTRSSADEEFLAAGTELRGRLFEWVEDVKATLRSAPKPNSVPSSPPEMLDELHHWVRTVTAITHDANMEVIYRLLGEIYALAKSIGGDGERKRLAELAHCTEGNIDYRVNRL